MPGSSVSLCMRAVSGWVSYFSWTYEAEIAPLSPEAARQTYLAIDSSQGDMNSDSLKTLDELLKELDYVPLAIRLLTTVGRGLSPLYLLGQWREECTELLELRKDRQSSIAVSISVSLSHIRKIKGFLKRLILLIRLKNYFKADKENKTRNLLKFF